MVVNATGDGDVAYRAGAEMVPRREEDGRFMQISLVLSLANVDVDRLLAYVDGRRDELQAIYDQAERAGFAVAAWYAYVRPPYPALSG